jgi:hypothetical protein
MQVRGADDIVINDFSGTDYVSWLEEGMSVTSSVGSAILSSHKVFDLHSAWPPPGALDPKP